MGVLPASSPASSACSEDDDPTAARRRRHSSSRRSTCRPRMGYDPVHGQWGPRDTTRASIDEPRTGLD
eukprot:32459-Eustigmatos_ZCMA.PRE.1